MSRSDVDFVLWDHDGVLVDTEPVFFEATRRTLGDYGIELTHERWLAFQAQGAGLARFVAESSNGRLDMREIRSERDDVYESLLDQSDVLIEGALEVLDDVASRCRMALVTTSLRRFVDQLHGHTSVLDYFEHIVTAEDCDHHKPHPEPYLRAMERLGASPDRSVAVEDSRRGLSSAVAAGVRCFVVRSDFMTSYTFDEAHAMLSGIRELPAEIGIASRGGLHGRPTTC